MRNLKRALSLALAAVMVLGLMVVGASAASYEDFTDKDEIKNTEAVNTMVSLGVISGKGDGSSYDPTGSLTRAEACTLIARMLGGGKDPVLGSNIKSNFTDTQGHWAENYIAYCANLGIIAGVGNGTFKPDDTLTGSAAAKMVLCALGYKPEFEGIGGANWELATNTLATKVKLYSGLEALNPSATISRDDVAQLIYNGVQADMVEYRNLQGDYSGTLYAQPVNGTAVDANGNRPDSSMLAERFGVVKVNGVVTGNDSFTLEVAPQRDGKTRVQLLNGCVYGDAGDPVTFNVDTDASLIGQKVVLYVKPTSKLSPNPSSDLVLGSAIVAASNVVVTTTDRYTANTTTDFAKFLSNNGLTGRGYSYVNYKSAANIISNLRGVELTIIDYDDDGVVDYKLAVTKSLARVSVYNTAKEELTLSNGTKKDFDDVIGVEDIALNDYVLYFEANGKLYVEKSEPVTATLESYVANSSVTLDGVKYNMSALGGMQDGTHLATIGDLTRFNNVSATGFEKGEIGGGLPDGTPAGGMKLGETYDLYLDKAGNIIAYELADETVGNYAVVLETVLNSNSMNSAPSGQVSLLLADGTLKTGALDIASTQKNYVKADDDVDTASAFANKYVNKTLDLYKNSTGASGSDGDPDLVDTSLLANTIVTYSEGSNGIVLKPTNYLRVDGTDYKLDDGDKNPGDNTAINTSTSYVKNMTNLVMTNGGNTLITNANTIFVFSYGKFGNENTAVIKGTANLSSTAGSASNIKAVAYNTRTSVAEVVYIMADPGTAVTNYAYVVKDPSVKTVDGADHHFYKAVLSDGTTTVFDTTEGTGLATGIYEYKTDSKGVTALEEAKPSVATGNNYLTDANNSDSIVYVNALNPNDKAYDRVEGRISALNGNIATVVDKNGTGSFILDVTGLKGIYVDDVDAPTQIDLTADQEVMISFKKVDNKPVVDAIYVTKLFTNVYTLSVNNSATATTYKANDRLVIPAVTGADKAFAYYKDGDTYHVWDGTDWDTVTFSSYSEMISGVASAHDVSGGDTIANAPAANVNVLGGYTTSIGGSPVNDSTHTYTLTTNPVAGTVYFGETVTLTVTHTDSGSAASGDVKIDVKADTDVIATLDFNDKPDDATLTCTYTMGAADVDFTVAKNAG